MSEKDDKVVLFLTRYLEKSPWMWLKLSKLAEITEIQKCQKMAAEPRFLPKMDGWMVAGRRHSVRSSARHTLDLAAPEACKQASSARHLQGCRPPTSSVPPDVWTKKPDVWTKTPMFGPKPDVWTKTPISGVFS